MKLTFIRPYKSIKTLSTIELPDFVVLTGINGSGKTHLLEAIANGDIQIDDIVSNKNIGRIVPSPIRLLDWSNLVPQDSEAIFPSQLIQETWPFKEKFVQETNNLRQKIKNILKTFNISRVIKYDFKKVIQMTEEDFVSFGLTTEEAREIVIEIDSTTQIAEDNILKSFIFNDISRREFIDLLRERTKVPFMALPEEEVVNYCPLNYRIIDIFQQSFCRLFLEYQRIWCTNKLQKLANLEGENITFLEDKEFIKQYGEPPWDVVNRILKVAKFGFSINSPRKFQDSPYEPILMNTVSGDQIKFADLSSGERILMAFTLCLYYAEDQRQIMEYPKILLFDEIDAPLHPMMTQSLLNIIQEILIDRHKIKVILTTHSPSTVALAPESALYVITKNEQKRLQKTTKDKALAILTSGVPTLSINYENRRQVFVESQYDVSFYEKIHEKLRDKLIPEISLNFISSGVDGKGNCDQVKTVVKSLYDYGNKTVYGIIDWDSKNNETHRTKVLGHGKRYSIENYIFDPILLTAFLLREKWISRAEVGLSDNEIYIDVAKCDNAMLQIIVDFITDRINQKILPRINRQDTYQCEYISGQLVDVPVWFLQTQGHQLEAALKQAFPQLCRFKKEDELKREILNKVIDDVPDLLSVDFIDLFKKIQDVDY
jgi:ABC-type branched-subunit amino acid transport system ATPase component